MASSFFPKINKDRILTIEYSDNGSSSATNKSWKNNLSRIIESCYNTHHDKTKDLYIMFPHLDDGIEAIKKEWDVNENIQLLLTDNKGLNSASSPENPLKSLSNVGNKKSMIGKVFSIATGVASAYSALNSTGTESTSGSFYPWVAGITAWNGGQKIKLNYKFDFAMGQYGLWNAKEEVVKPIMNLMAPTIPQYMNPTMIYGSYPNSWKLIADFLKSVVDAISGGENFLDENGQKTTYNTNAINFGEGGLQDLAILMEDIILTNYSKFTYNITCGNMFTYFDMLPISSKVEWSNEVDQNGYPIAGTITLDFEGLMPITLSSFTPYEMAVGFKQPTKGSSVAIADAARERIKQASLDAMAAQQDNRSNKEKSRDDRQHSVTDSSYDAHLGDYYNQLSPTGQDELDVDVSLGIFKGWDYYFTL